MQWAAWYFWKQHSIKNQILQFPLLSGCMPLMNMSVMWNNTTCAQGPLIFSGKSNQPMNE